MATNDIQRVDLTHAENLSNPEASAAALKVALDQIQKLDAKDVECFVFCAKLKTKGDEEESRSGGLFGLAGPSAMCEVAAILLLDHIQDAIEKNAE